jgi:hypothetical protein
MKSMRRVAVRRPHIWPRKIAACQFLGERLLADAGPMSRRDKQRDEALISSASEGFLHSPPAMDSGSRQSILDSDYPKNG